jgi:cytochrome P450
LFSSNRASQASTSPIAAFLPHPSMARWPLLNRLTGYEGHTQFQIMCQMVNYVKPFVDEHKNTFDATVEPRDFVDKWLLEMECKKNVPSSAFSPELGTEGLIATLVEFIQAGMDTTTHSLVWLFLILLHYPEIQLKVQAEIDQLIGRERQPSLQDRANMHYTNALLHEAFRIIGLAFNAVPHVTTSSCKIGNHSVPKGTMLFMDIYGIMNDSKIFVNPDQFKPERFLEQDHFKPSEYVVPFSIGKRQCIGMPLAENEYFLFFTGLLQKFDLHPGQGTLPGFGPYVTKPQLIRTAPPFQIKLTLRN